MKKKNGKRRAVRPVVFTGVRKLMLGQFSYVDEVLEALRGNVFISGGAPGMDQYCSEYCVENFKGAKHIVVIPFNYKQGNDIHLIKMEKAGAEIIYLPRPPRRNDVPELVRNSFMITTAMEMNGALAKLVAFPGGPDEVLRSGTWSTIRRARKAGMKIELHPLSEATGQSLGGHIYS